jgi:hypothetical protein
LFLTSHFLLGFNAVKRRYPPVLNWICLAAGVVVYAAYSSRMSAVAVALFAFGACLSRPGKTSAIIMAVSLAVLPIALYVPLYMREMSYQGLVPMAHELFGGNLMRNFEMRVVLANSITAGFMVSALTATTANIDLPYMLTSLNPMPGALTDWAEFTHDLNPSTPYSVLGEWLNFGLPSSILFHGLLGALFAYFGFKARAGDKLYLTVGTGILFLTTLMMLQYNTRMSTRFIYYFVVIVLARFGYRQFRKVID